MAGELFPIRYTSGRTLYAQLLRSGAQVADAVGHAWVTPVAADWANYAVTLAELGTSTYYSGSLPAWINTAGSFTLVAYEQLGATPDAGDPDVWTAAVEWKGSAEATLAGVEVAARAQAFGRWAVDTAGSTLTLYAEDGTTPLQVFDLTGVGGAYVARVPR